MNKLFALWISLIYSTVTLGKGLIFGLQSGAGWGNPGETQTLNFIPDYPLTYVALKQQQTIATGGLFLGYEFDSIEPLLKTQWSIIGVTTSSFSLDGEIWQDDNPLFDNDDYHYRLKHSHLGVQGHLVSHHFSKIQPYVGATLAIGFNQSYGYHTQIRTLQVDAMPPFSSNTSCAFTYAVDAGIQQQLNQHWYIGVAYEFTDWGNSQLGGSSMDPPNNSLKLNHTYLNQLLLNLLYKA